MISHTPHNEIRLAELACADVDRKLQITCVRGLFPISLFVCRRFPIPIADRQNESGFFSQRNELYRRHHADTRMLPTQQCFCADSLIFFIYLHP